MNPRRIHDLMRKRFPPVEHVSREWAVVQRDGGSATEFIAVLLAKHILKPEVLIEVHRNLGALLPVADAPAYIADHIGEGEIRVANRDFTGFVVVAHNGVATGWHDAGQPLRSPAGDRR